MPVRYRAREQAATNKAAPLAHARGTAPMEE